jgi:hypothetical protein
LERFGKAKLSKKIIKAFTIVLVLIFLKGIAFGNLVDAHIMVNKYWLPDLVLSKGPTQSTIILLNGSSNAGIGYK